MLYDACVNILMLTKGAVYICMSSSELDRLQTGGSATHAATGQAFPEPSEDQAVMR
jgi:hypothetical protein